MRKIILSTLMYMFTLTSIVQKKSEVQYIKIKSYMKKTCWNGKAMMKKLLLLIFNLCFCTMLQAQVSKIVNITTAGSLNKSLTSSELTTITKLTVAGTIN